jgi:predicted acetyltransferase
MKITLLKATKEDKNTIQNLGRFYVYEMSRYCGFLPTWETPSNGLYECIDLSSYCEKLDRHAFLVKVDDELAGFALINKVGSAPDVEWNVGEFFIVSKFQGKGVGSYVAEQIFNQFPGTWETTQIPENQAAIDFWEKVVNKFSNGKFEKTRKIIPEPKPHPMIVLKFISSGLELHDKQQAGSEMHDATTTREIREKDIDRLTETFCFPWSSAQATSNKWKQYYEEHEKQIRTVYLLERQGRMIGYASLLRNSNYPDFKNNCIPEINDVWITAEHRGKGFGKKLVQYLEKIARQESYSQIGIGVGLYNDYGRAQKLYVDLGYVPDGHGVTYNYQPVVPGESYPIDDDLVIWLKKDLS